MAGPDTGGKILNSNVSSYNLIAHEHHVPQSPPFGPVQRHHQTNPYMDYEPPRTGQGKVYAHTREDPEGKQWNNMKENEARRYEHGNQVTNDYRTMNNAIPQEQHLPTSPLYRPNHNQGVVQIDPRYRSYQDERRGGDEGRNYQVSPRVTNGVEAGQQSNRHVNTQNILSATIGDINHVPVSPLYRPGLGRGLNLADPRYGSPQRRGQQLQFKEVPRPKQPPTPDYNTTNLNIPNNNSNNNIRDDLNLQLGGLKNSQEDLRDYQQNNASWAGYQDRPIFQGSPYTDRSGYRGDRSYRENPWTSREAGVNYVADPRVGGHHEGKGLVGNRNGGALLFIRFPVGQGENVQVAAQAFLKSKTLDTGGRFLGLAKKVFDFGYEKGPIEGIGVFHFPSTERAFMFFQMDPILRQPDFPPPSGHAESWIINNAYLPDNLQLFSTFLLSEIEMHNGKDKREFFETFQKPFESYLYKNGAMPFVICSYGEKDRKSIRRHMYSSTSIVTCHLFQGLDHLNWITNDETYSKFRSLHNQMATERCSIFNISRDMFP